MKNVKDIFLIVIIMQHCVETAVAIPVVKGAFPLDNPTKTKPLDRVAVHPQPCLPARVGSGDESPAGCWGSNAVNLTIKELF